MAKALTKRQTEVLRYIARTQREKGWAPTVKEMCEAFGWGSTHSAFMHLTALAERGAITREARSPRAIRITTAGRRAL